MATLQGILRQTFDCGDDGERVTWLIEDEQGNSAKVKPLPDDTMLNKPVQAIMSRGVVQSVSPINVLQTQPVTPLGGEILDKRLSVFKIIQPGHVPSEAEKKKLKEFCRKIEECTYYTSRGMWLVEVKGYFLPESCNPTTYNGCSLAIRNFRNEHGIDTPYDLTWGGRLSGYCGHASVCARGIYARVYSYCGASSGQHEYGHNAHCLRHAGRVRSNGAIVAYGDPDCYMGSGNMNGLNAAMQYYAGIHNPDGFVELTNSAELHLAPIEWLDERWPGESQVVRVEREDAYYFISRRKYPWPYGCRQYSSDKVFVHRTKSRTEKNTTYLLEELAEGEVFEKSGLKIAHVTQGRDVSKVQVLLDGALATSPLSTPVRPSLPVVESPLSVFDIGYWRDHRTSGQGYELYIIPPRLDIVHTQVLMFVYTYNVDGSPKRVWYMCDGRLENGVGVLTVYQPQNNGSSMPAIGSARVWREADQLVIDWHTMEHGRARIRLSRLLTSVAMAPELTGVWGARDMERQGITLQARGRRSDTRGPVLYGFWWGYNSSGGQNWLELDGGAYVPGCEEYELEAYRNSLGRWADPRPVEKVVYGQMQLRVLDDEHKQMVLLLAGTEVSLKRITPEIQTP